MNKSKDSINFRNIEVFEIEYNRDKVLYLISDPTKNEKDFIENKIKHIQLQIDEKVRKSNLSDDEFYLEYKNDKNYAALFKGLQEQDAKKLFFENRLAYYRKQCKVDGKFEDYRITYYKTKLQSIVISKETPEDDNLGISAIEKVIYLHELGIIDFLKTKQPFNTSVNSLASVLSKITSEKPQTIQSYLNPLLNDTTVQRNNPNNSKKSEIVKNHLNSIGFKLK